MYSCFVCTLCWKSVKFRSRLTTTLGYMERSLGKSTMGKNAPCALPGSTNMDFVPAVRLANSNLLCWKIFCLTYHDGVSERSPGNSNKDHHCKTHNQHYSQRKFWNHGGAYDLHVSAGLCLHAKPCMR